MESPYNKAVASQVSTVEDCLSASLYDKVDIKVKVVTKSENKQPVVHREKTKYRVECLVADHTESIKLILWEDAIEKVHSSKSYHFQNLTVRIFDDDKYLNTSELTVIDEIDDIHDINLSSPPLEDNLVTAKCVGIDIKKSSSCFVFNSSLDTQETTEETITFPNCNITTLASLCKTKLVCQILLQTADNISSFTCFNDALQSFLKSINCQTALSDIEINELKKLLLTAGPQQMIVSKSQRLISVSDAKINVY